MALVAFLILLFVSIAFGTLTFPSQDELLLVFSAFSLLVLSWFYSKEKRRDKTARLEAEPEEERKKKERK